MKTENSTKNESNASDHTLVLIDQYLEVPDGNGRCFHKLAVMGGKNEFVKNIIESSMRRLERQVSENNGSSYVNVLRNDGKLISYVSGFNGSDYSHTDYSKTISVDDGNELELSDIIINMDMLPKAMYAESYQIRDDYDDFVDYVDYLLDENELYWSVNRFGINLIPSDEITVEILSKGWSHPVKAYGFNIFLSYAKYPQLFNSEYFEDVNEDMTPLYDSKMSFNEKSLEILNGIRGDNETYPYSLLWYAPDLDLMMYVDRDWGYFNELYLYDYANENVCKVEIGDGVNPTINGYPYLMQFNNNRYIVYCLAYYLYDDNNNETNYFAETLVFRVNDKEITLTDRVDGIINLGGGTLSPEGFYMNTYEELYVNGLDESSWNSQPMYKLTNDGKIVRK